MLFGSVAVAPPRPDARRLSLKLVFKYVPAGLYESYVDSGRVFVGFEATVCEKVVVDVVVGGM